MERNDREAGRQDGQAIDREADTRETELRTLSELELMLAGGGEDNPEWP